MLVGGTALYVQAVVDDLEIPGQYPGVRAALEADAGTRALHARLTELDPLAAGRMEPTNRRRILRALEVTIGSGESKTVTLKLEPILATVNLTSEQAGAEVRVDRIDGPAMCVLPCTSSRAATSGPSHLW